MYLLKLDESFLNIHEVLRYEQEVNMYYDVLCQCDVYVYTRYISATLLSFMNEIDTSAYLVYNFNALQL